MKDDKEQEQENKKKETWNFRSPKRNLSLPRKAAKRTTGACRLPSPSGASFIYTSCSRSSASPLLPRGISACPDVQLFVWSSDKSSWAAFHILRTNRGGRHSPSTVTAHIIQPHSQQSQELFVCLMFIKL